MSIHAADALMGIFGFKRVAGDEITLDNPPSLDDDGGSLNEGMKMSEVKNEGLEVVAVIEIGDPDHETGACDSLEIIPNEVEFIVGEKLCRHSEALAGYAVRDARIAELELLAAAISADCNDMANERNQFRAELAAIKAQEPVGYVVEKRTGSLTTLSGVIRASAILEDFVTDGTPLYATPSFAPQQLSGVRCDE